MEFWLGWIVLAGILLAWWFFDLPTSVLLGIAFGVPLLLNTKRRRRKGAFGDK